MGSKSTRCRDVLGLILGTGLIGSGLRIIAAVKTAILLFDGVTALDAVGPYDVLNRIPGNEIVFVAKRPGTQHTHPGPLGLVAQAALADVTDADVLLIPGGEGTRPLMDDSETLTWLCEIDQTTRWTTSVCTGSLLLAAAGILKGRRATTHWLFRERLTELGATLVTDRVVEEGKLITAAGVSSGIDMALHLVQRELGDDATRAIQLSIEYDPQPLFDAGSPESAPPETTELVRSIAAARSDL